MAGLKVILTGATATGMVGEGALLACLASPAVERVPLVSRSHYALAHPRATSTRWPATTPASSAPA